MNNAETLATLGTQDTGRRPKKKKQKNKQTNKQTTHSRENQKDGRKPRVNIGLTSAMSIHQFMDSKNYLYILMLVFTICEGTTI